MAGVGNSYFAAVYWGMSMSSEGLSPREREIVAAVARGLSNRDIASATGIAQQTVKNHLSSIFQKLNVHSRVQLAVLALRNGQSDPPI
jgi:DNA-binding NarL/FixJ family response regulator